MARKSKRRAPAPEFSSAVRLSAEDIQPGVYPIDSGVAEIMVDPFTPEAWLLMINGAESSQLTPHRPTLLGFEYMRWAAAVITHRFATDTALRFLHLGAAGCTMARWASAVYPGARQVAVEIDAGLAALARERFGLPRAPALRIRVGEAGAVLAAAHPGSRDVVMRDVFTLDDTQTNHITPPHLTGVEAAEAARSVLEPGGLYIVNYGGSPDLSAARSEAATLAEVFSTVVLISDPAMFKGRRRGNIIMVATQGPVVDESLGGFSSLTRTLLSDSLPAQVRTDPRAFAGSAPINTTALSLTGIN